LVVAVLASVGCGAPQKKPKTQSDRTTVEKMDRNWSPDEESWSEGETSDTPSAHSDRVDIREINTTTAVATGEESERREPDGYEMTYSDCNVLANHYYQVIAQEEFGKIPDGLKQAQRTAAENAAKESAQKGKQQWQDQCAGLVGTAYQRSWLKCAMAATTVSGFTKCVTGEGGE
jgi:hypothetical protein